MTAQRVENSLGWTIAVVFFAWLLWTGITAGAQEKPRYPLQVWQIYQQTFLTSGQTVVVFKFQVGERAFCKASVRQYGAVASLGDVPCPE